MIKRGDDVKGFKVLPTDG